MADAAALSGAAEQVLDRVGQSDERMLGETLSPMHLDSTMELGVIHNLALGALSYPGVLHWLCGKQVDPQLYSAFFEVFV